MRRSCASDVNSAEMISSPQNAFLMTRISFINAIANVCEATGADVVKVAEGIGLDKRLRPALLAPASVTAARLPEGLRSRSSSSASNSGYHFRALRGDRGQRAARSRRVIAKLKRHLGPLRGKTVGAARAGFKANTDDMREAPSIVLASRLLARARRCVRGTRSPTDKLPKGVDVVASIADAVRGADAAVIVTEWDG